MVRKIFNLNQTGILIPFNSIIKLASGKRIRKGISIICLGEQSVDELPMQYISNFKNNSIITVLDFPKDINENSGFHKHFDKAMSLFAYHMTNIVIAVDYSKWMLYNFNASHPIYQFSDGKFDEHILNGLIPKIVAPISPHTFKEFKISDYRFDIKDDMHAKIIGDIRQGAELFSKTGLYPEGKKIDDLPFRHNFHRFIGKMHLDNRNGMSFGFLAFQMPTKLSNSIMLETFKKQHQNAFLDKDFFIDEKTNDIFISVELEKQNLVFRVPDVWVMTLRSGSDKTHFDPNKDLLKLGLINGKMWMEFPQDLEINHDYKPSFDTKVILAHAVGNAIIASIAKYLNPKHRFVDVIKNEGMSLSHWHGYFNKNHLPEGIDVYGQGNPHVSCSSPQSAIYALDGKLKSFWGKISTFAFETYRGDIHIEPHHGINISYPSLSVLAKYILENPNATELGNKYL